MKLTRCKKWIFGSGDTGFSLTTTVIGAYFAIFLTDVVGISPGIAAIAIFAGRSWDYINDPIIGYLSDRTRTRWGRRRPFLIFGALPFAAAFTMLWWKPPWDGTIALAAYYAAAYVLFDTAATFLYMPYFALTPELTSNYDERTSLTTYRMFFSILGSLIAFTIPLLIIGSFRPENASKVLTMGLLFGIVSALPIILVFFGTRERQEYIEMEPPKFLRSLRGAVKNRPFLFSIGIYLFTWLAVDIMQTMLLYFIKYCVQRESQGDLIMGSIFISAIFALPIWNWASRRWDKRAAFIFGVAFWGIVQLLIVTLGASTSLTMLLSLCVLAGFGVAAAHVLPWAIIPDAVEWDEWKTGERHEGMYYSIVTLVRKITSSISIPLALILLEATGYKPNAAAGQQSEASVLVIRILTGPIPAVILGLGILFAVFYPLKRREYEEICRELEQRRAKKKKAR